MSLPIIDLESPDAASAIKQACLSSGFFYVTNHGVPDAVIADMFAQSKAFFKLPVDVKEKVLATEATKNKGYTMMGEETLDTEKQKKGDTKEGYYLGREPTEEEKNIGMMGMNVWPDETDVPGWKKTMETYIEKATVAGLRIVRKIAENLGVDVDEFMKMFDLPVATLRLLRYAEEKSDEREGVYGAGAHTDYGMITLLAVADGEPGLEIHHDGQWIPVSHVPSSFIVNLGDLLQRWTNDAYHSTLHRVINVRGMERHSTAFFFDPAYPTMVSCLDSFQSEANPPRYPPIKFLDHLLKKYDETHSGFDSKELS
eukprot:TRINITY_DN9491_c0_g1_i1.p1 TRINITY_DN9491_c0_g1~~TRINITY_DN9491_c0_g1_i1.p1  ORF type:complete len:313 (+),score=62.80 TRINITY_DN9491_c0_g1_i1:540-1478(+)